MVTVEALPLQCLDGGLLLGEALFERGWVILLVEVLVRTALSLLVAVPLQLPSIAIHLLIRGGHG